MDPAERPSQPALGSWRHLAGTENVAKAIGITKHTVYVTLGAPLTTSNQETVFYLGCRNQGNQTDPKSVVDTIYTQFAAPALKVCRVGTTKGMTYWGPWAITPAARAANPNCFSTAGLLANGDGRCGAWANLLVDVISAQGISGATLENVNPLDNVPSLGFKGFGILVNNWNITSRTTAIRLVGISAQSNFKMPKAYFNGGSIMPGSFAHAMVGFMKTLYDPSYGTKYTQATMGANRQAWEDASLAAIVVIDASGNQQIIRHVKGTQQTQMTP